MPFSEDADTSRPLSPYAASKKAAEVMAFTYHHLHKLDVTHGVATSPFMGRPGRPDMSVFRFVRRIAEGEPITVFSDGQQRRDFTYVDDIARGTIAALRYLWDTKSSTWVATALTTLNEMIAADLRARGSRARSSSIARSTLPMYPRTCGESRESKAAPGLDAAGLTGRGTPPHCWRGIGKTAN